MYNSCFTAADAVKEEEDSSEEESDEEETPAANGGLIERPQGATTKGF